MDERLLIDTDNAAGSPSGDVDDAFAVAALLFVAASPSRPWPAWAATRAKRRRPAATALSASCAGYTGPYLRGVEAEEVPERIDRAGALQTAGSLRYVALGPLTNLAAVLGKAAISEAVLVGGNLTSRGRFPPWWPHEFNLTHDREATRAVFASDLPLTLVPLDVARRLRTGPEELKRLPGELGSFLRRCSVRWARRSLLVRGSRRFPVFDLAAAAYVIDPSLVTVEETRARLHSNLWLEFGRGPLEVFFGRAFQVTQRVREPPQRFFERLLDSRRAWPPIQSGEPSAARQATFGTPKNEPSSRSMTLTLKLANGRRASGGPT